MAKKWRIWDKVALGRNMIRTRIKDFREDMRYQGTPWECLGYPACCQNSLLPALSTLSFREVPVDGQNNERPHDLAVFLQTEFPPLEQSWAMGEGFLGCGSISGVGFPCRLRAEHFVEFKQMIEPGTFLGLLVQRYRMM